MKTRAKLFLAKLLIFFSIALILCGVYLQFSENTVLDPEKDVTVIAGANDNISVTPVDKDDVKEEKNSSSEVTNPPVVTSPSSPPVQTPSDNQTPITTPDLAQTPSSPVETTPIPTVDEANVALRNEIESKYGVKVKYGSEVSGYNVGGMSTMIIDDATAARTALNNLNSTLSYYPTDLFREISNNGYPLTIYLIKRYSTANVTGVTDSSRNNIIISIATDYSFADTLHHEVYHYIEKYIYSKGFRFTSWNTLNPVNFNYGVINLDLAYSRMYSADVPFVNSYAQTNEFEDRASTFEYMMMPNKASCFNYGKTVWLKARTMSEQIDYFLSSVKPDVVEYWERFVY